MIIMQVQHCSRPCQGLQLAKALKPMTKVGCDKQVLVLCTIVQKCWLMQANPLLINREHYNGKVAAHKVTHWLKLALACDGV